MKKKKYKKENLVFIISLLEDFVEKSKISQYEIIRELKKELKSYE